MECRNVYYYVYVEFNMQISAHHGTASLGVDFRKPTLTAKDIWKDINLKLLKL